MEEARCIYRSNEHRPAAGALNFGQIKPGGVLGFDEPFVDPPVGQFDPLGGPFARLSIDPRAKQAEKHRRKKRDYEKAKHFSVFVRPW